MNDLKDIIELYNNDRGTEITPEMAVAVGSSRAHRVLLPMEQCGTSVAGVESAPLSKLVEMAVQQVKTCIGMPQSQSTER